MCQELFYAYDRVTTIYTQRIHYEPFTSNVKGSRIDDRGVRHTELCLMI